MQRRDPIKKLLCYFLLSISNVLQLLSIESLNIYNAEKPLVSIIIPAYNHYDYTYNCLQSIARDTTTIPFEVLVVDDCSTDETWNALSKNKNIRAIHNEKNVGFIEACNNGARVVQGKFLIFLNNDTEVHQGWIEAFLNVYNNHRNVGLVGAKLIYPNGKLQEAGSILYSDGGGYRYGWMQDSQDSRFNYVREVDYVSGAAIMIKSDLFKKLNGFDQYYSPAYYEDTDLAQKVRRAGLRVIYQPEAEVVHYESITLADKKLKQIGTNSKKFFARWKIAIATHPTHETPIELCCDHRCNNRILIIDSCEDLQMQNILSQSSVQIKLKSLKSLVKNSCKVYYFPLGMQFNTEFTRECQQLGIQVINESFDTIAGSWILSYGSWLNFILIPCKEHHSALGESLQKTVSNVFLIPYEKHDNFFSLLEEYIV